MTQHNTILNQLKELEPGEIVVLETAGKASKYVKTVIYWTGKYLGTRYKTIIYFDGGFHVQRLS